MTEPEQEDVERGAAEEGSGVPLTPTEEEVSNRAPGGPGAGLDGGDRLSDDG